MNTTFARYYPQSYATGTSLTQLTADAQTRWTYSRGAVQTSMQLQAQATQNQATDESTLSSLVNQSQSAVGALQASQATNQLLALIARELMQEQQLRLTQDRAAALEQARPVAAQTSSLTVRQQFIGSGIAVHAADGQLLQRQLEIGHERSVGHRSVPGRLLALHRLGFRPARRRGGVLDRDPGRDRHDARRVVLGDGQRGSHRQAHQEDALRRRLRVHHRQLQHPRRHHLSIIRGSGTSGLGVGTDPGPTAATGPARRSRRHGRAADLAADRTALGLSRGLLEPRQHRRAVPRVDHRHRELLRPRGAAIRDADRVQADHARRLRARALCALEQDRIPRRESAGERGFLGREGVGPGGHRRHRLDNLQPVPVAGRAPTPSLNQALAIMLGVADACWGSGSSDPASPRAWSPALRSWARALPRGRHSASEASPWQGVQRLPPAVQPLPPALAWPPAALWVPCGWERRRRSVSRRSRHRGGWRRASASARVLRTSCAAARRPPASGGRRCQGRERSFRRRGQRRNRREHIERRRHGRRV